MITVCPAGEHSDLASSSCSLGASSTIINMTATTKPRPNDVLLGRGSGASNWEGNKQFRRLAEEQKEEYVAACKYRDKKRIAQEFLNHIHSLGGRFLQLSEDSKMDCSNIVKEGSWCIVPADIALEKCKQSLREKPHHQPVAPKAKKRQTKVQRDKKQKEKHDEKQNGARDEKQKETRDKRETQEQETVKVPELDTPPVASISPLSSIDEGLVDLDSFDAADHQVQSPEAAPSSCLEEPAAASFPPVLPPTVSSPVAHPSVDSRLHLFQQGASLQSHQPSLLADVRSPLEETCSHHNSLRAGMQHEASQEQHVTDNAVRVCLSTGGDPDELQKSLDCYDATSDISPLPKEAPVQEDMAENLLSMLSLSGRQMISEEQEERELASLTDSEQADVLADVFGDFCTLGTRPEKRAKKDLDADSILFLVGQMRLELERIPKEKKQALLEAQLESHPDEFSDVRLTTFLRCEGMNAKLAAKRFVTYWECRKEVFGPIKYLLRMRLDEALCNDMVALEAGLICRLPHPDLSGRTLIFVEPSRHTRQGYTSESMARALWYTIETIAHDNNAIDAGIVQVLWDAHSTMFDYDRKVNDRINHFRDSAWPVRLAAQHTCCSPKFIIRVLKPILMALKTKTTRTRTLFHDVPQDEILGVLSNYGILPSMLPTDMGGTVVLNQSEWIANRWAIEMEEI